MTSLDRYLGVIRGTGADVVPRLPILMQFAAEYIGSDYGHFAADYRVLVEANRRCRADFDFDQVSAISDPYRETAGFGAEMDFVPDGVPRCLTRVLPDKDLGRLSPPDPETAPRMRDRLDAIRAFAAADSPDCSVLGWVEGPAAEAADLFGVTEFLMATMDDEAFTADLMDRCLETAIAFGKAQIAAGADTVGVGDAVASQVPPDYYEAFIQPREKRLTQALHDAGALVRLHICGNVTHLLPGIADLGVDIVDLDHMVNMTRAREALGSTTVLAGNLDPVAVVHEGTPQQIRDGFRRLYEAVGNPYMVTAGCEIPAGTPSANLKAVCAPIPYAGGA